MRPRQCGLRRRPLLLLLLLLLAAAAARVGLCGSYAAEEAEPLVDQSDAVGIEHPSEQQSEAGGASSSGASAAAATAAAAGDGDGLSADGLLEEEGEEMGGSVLTSSFDRGGPLASRLLRRFQKDEKVRLAVGGALLGLLLLFVLAGERRLAAAKAAHVQGMAYTELSAEGKAVLDEASKREEEKISSTKQQMDKLVRKRREAITQISEFARRQAVLKAKLADIEGGSDSHVSLSKLEEARKRLEEAQRQRECALRDLTVQQAVSGLTEATAPVMKQQLEEEAAGVEAELSAASRTIEQLMQASSVDKVLMVKQETELAALEAALEQEKARVRAVELEARVGAAKQAKSSEVESHDGDDSDAEENAEMYKALLESQCRRLQKAHDAQRDMEKALESKQIEMAAKLENAVAAKKRLESELQRLESGPARLSAFQDQLKKASWELKRLSEQIDGLVVQKEEEAKKAAEAADKKRGEEETEEEQLKSLTPEERQLYEARLNVRQIELRQQALEAERGVLSLLPEKLHFLKSLRDVVAAKVARASALAEDPTAGLAGGETTEGAAFSGMKDKAFLTRQRLLDKEERLKSLDQELKRLGGELVKAKERVARCERKVLQTEITFLKRLGFPRAFANKEAELLTTECANLEQAVLLLRAKNRNFTERVFQNIPPQVRREVYWKDEVEKDATQCLHLLHELFRKVSRLMLALRQGEDHLFAYRLQGELLRMPFEELVAEAVKGTESPLRQQLVERRMAKIQEEAEELEKQLDKSRTEVASLRNVLDRIAISRFWDNSTGPRKMKAFSYIERLEGRQEFCVQRLQYLHSISRGDVEQQMTELLLESAWTGKELREAFGTNERALQAALRARQLALEALEQRQRSYDEVFEKQDSILAPPIVLKDSPLYDPPKKKVPRSLPRLTNEEQGTEGQKEENEKQLGDLTGVTLSNQAAAAAAAAAASGPDRQPPLFFFSFLHWGCGVPCMHACASAGGSMLLPPGPLSLHAQLPCMERQQQQPKQQQHT
ncbi:hypothetical protein Efla_000798 [Eimeria flavescens]